MKTQELEKIHDMLQAMLKALYPTKYRHSVNIEYKVSKYGSVARIYCFCNSSKEVLSDNNEVTYISSSEYSKLKSAVSNVIKQMMQLDKTNSKVTISEPIDFMDIIKSVSEDI